jgi:hypothetical protein
MSTQNLNAKLIAVNPVLTQAATLVLPPYTKITRDGSNRSTIDWALKIAADGETSSYQGEGLLTTDISFRVSGTPACLFIDILVEDDRFSGCHDRDRYYYAVTGAEFSDSEWEILTAATARQAVIASERELALAKAGAIKAARERKLEYERERRKARRAAVEAEKRRERDRRVKATG